MNSLSLKQNLIELLINQLTDNLNIIINSALETKAAAVREEAKPENKYDTRSIEASYLAGAHAERSSVLHKEIDQLKRLNLREFSKDDWIDLTAIVKLTNDSGELKYFILLPFAGGTKIDFKNQTYYVITPKSPIGLQINKKRVGEVFLIKGQNSTTEYEIQEIM